MQTESPRWRRSSRCSGGTCVEVAVVEGQYLVRDGKNPEQRHLSFTHDEWVAFVAGVKNDEFN
ncbi:DUF397 domain-containing protein [Actinoplanes sp. NPDC049596]|uniref:DUF397 domain-containing protein n=1 Tax=unclassified Actinoplanes TaxID=2626549 RepID=UPI0034265022